uniref:Uncharacterized protein n=1 Tax=Nothobranchius furzeri TaxID=105023 RepID=A0A8C6LUJ6_NOTFU
MRSNKKSQFNIDLMLKMDLSWYVMTHICILSDPPTDGKFLLDHLYGTPEWQIDHQYASPGAKWQKDLDPLQSSLVEYVLDQNRPPGELLVKEDKICLTREDFWSLGLEQSMESTIGNACLKIVGEAAQRHGKDVHIADLYVVTTWKDPQVNLLRCLPESSSLY